MQPHAGTQCQRAPTMASFMAASSFFSHDILLMQPHFSSAPPPTKETELCMPFDTLIHCNIHISSRFTSSDGLSQSSCCVLLLLESEALLRFIGQNLGSTKSNGKSCQVFHCVVQCGPVLFLVLAITMLSSSQIIREKAASIGALLESRIQNKII